MRDRKRLQVLVDTTFLLPTLGIEVEEHAQEVIPLFRKIRVYYLEVSILEALWKLVKLKIDPLTLESGIEAIRSTYNELLPKASALRLALALYEVGHMDLIDNLLYASSLKSGMFFLTIDEEFLDFLRIHKQPLSHVLTPHSFKKAVKRD